jgi:hypothetical protein
MSKRYPAAKAAMVVCLQPIQKTYRNQGAKNPLKSMLRIKLFSKVAHEVGVGHGTVERICAGNALPFRRRHGRVRRHR